MVKKEKEVSQNGDVAVIGVGMYPYGKYPDKTPQELGVHVIREALKDAGIDWKDVQAMAASCSYNLSGGVGHLPGHYFAQSFGETGIPIVNVSNACASGGSALRAIRAMINSGLCDIGIAVGVDICPGGFYRSFGGSAEWDVDYVRWRGVGMENPSYWALECRRRMAEYGTTEEDLALTKVVSSRHAQYNPYARYKKVFTVEEVLASPMVCSPLRVVELCPTSDGAAAAILCSMKKARQLTTKPIVLTGCSLTSSTYGDPTLRITQLSAPAKAEAPLLSDAVLAFNIAYEEAGIGPEDLSFAELPDNSAWHYLVYMEAASICKPGEAEKLLREGATAIGGKIPVSPSGGPSSLGEAYPAQGIAQMCEMTWQLRGEAGKRQVEEAKVALGQTYGAQGNSSAIIMKR